MDLYCENTDLQLNRKFLRAVSNGGQGTLQTASSSLEVPGGDSRDKTQSQGSHANAERKGRGSKQVGAVTDALISRHTLSLPEARLRRRRLSSPSPSERDSFPFMAYSSRAQFRPRVCFLHIILTGPFSVQPFDQETDKQVCASQFTFL